MHLSQPYLEIIMYVLLCGMELHIITYSLSLPLPLSSPEPDDAASDEECLAFSFLESSL